MRWTVAALWIAVGVCTSPQLQAENWPGWRGPRGDGTSPSQGVPQTWNGETGENIAWKVSVPGVGHSSPIVWGDRIFVTTYLEETHDRLLLAYDRAKGGELWRKVVTQSPPERLHQLNSLASGTPATDGKLVYVTFLENSGDLTPAKNVGNPRPMTPGQILVAAYDLEGKPVWAQRVGAFSSVHGFCSCPVLFEETVIVNGDHDGDSYIVALDKLTGETKWKVNRDHKTRSYVTPLIREAGGKTQMVFSGSKHIISLDPRTGERIWSIAGPTEQFVASMVYDGERLFMAAGFPDYHVMAIRPDGTGDVTESHVAWHSREAKCYVPSPVVVDGYLMVANDDGIAHCFNAKTGEHLWKARNGRHYSASLVTARGLVYFMDDDGVTKLVRPGATLEIVAENKLGEQCFASPAIADDDLIVRTHKSLIRIANASAKPE